MVSGIPGILTGVLRQDVVLMVGCVVTCMSITPCQCQSHDYTAYMKKRSGEAQAAQHRPPVMMKHRLEGRGGAKNDQPELLEEAPEFEPDDGFEAEPPCAHIDYHAPGAESGDMRVYCINCGDQL